MSRTITEDDAAHDGWRERLLALPGTPTPAGLAARAAGLVVLGSWTVVLLRYGNDADYLMSSFMHLVNIPFHEAGHVLLSPFGRFLSVLGGSLFQVAIPIACCAVLLVRTGDAFGAAVTAWWAGESFVDLAPYIADARALQLVLLGGRTGAEVEGHDWEYLLATLGWLQRDVALGRLSFALGALVMTAAVVWGAAVTWRSWQNLADR